MKSPIGLNINIIDVLNSFIIACSNGEESNNFFPSIATILPPAANFNADLNPSAVLLFSPPSSVFGFTMSLNPFIWVPNFLKVFICSPPIDDLLLAPMYALPLGFTNLPAPVFLCSHRSVFFIDAFISRKER